MKKKLLFFEIIISVVVLIAVGILGSYLIFHHEDSNEITIPEFTENYYVYIDAGDGEHIQCLKVNCNEDIALPEVEERTGYDFCGWYSNSDFEGEPITKIQATNETYDVRIYGKWVEKTYSITYKDKGGYGFSGEHEENYPTSHTYGQSTTLESPTKNDLEFGGWFDNPNCVGTALTELSATAYSDDIVLYAKWRPISAFTLTSNGELQLTDYGKTLSVLEIPTEIDGVQVKSIGSNAFYNNKTITSLVIPEGVVIIGERAFSGCSNLESVILPNGLTHIGVQAFEYCGKMKTIVFPKTIKYIGDFAFHLCSNYIVYFLGEQSEWSANSLPAGAQTVFYSEDEPADNRSAHWHYVDEVPTLWQELEVYAINESGAISLTSYGKTLTGTLEIPSSINSISVTAIRDGGFSSAQASNIIIPEGVVSIGYSAFSGAGVVSVTLPSSLQSIGYQAFYYCTRLVNIVVPSGVETIGERAFAECSRLQSIVIPTSVTSAGDYTFSGVYYYKIYYAGTSEEWATLSLKGINYAYILIYSEEEPDENKENQWHYVDGVPTVWEEIEDVTEIYNVVDGAVSLTTYGRTLTGVLEIPSKIDGTDVTSLAKDGFRNCHATSVIIPEGVTRIDDYAFFGSETIASIALPDSLTEIMNYSFYGCVHLTDITIPEDVTIIGNGAFEYCSSITGIVIPGKVTSIGDYAFQYCSKLASVTIPNSVTSIGSNAFNYCSVLPEITIPNSITAISAFLFYGCSSLTDITLPNTITSIGNYAFSYCQIESFTVTSDVETIGNFAFQYCSALRDVYASSFTKTEMIDILSVAELSFATIHCSDGDMTYGCDYEYILNNGTKKYLTFAAPGWYTMVIGINIPEFGMADTCLRGHVARQCENLTSITLPERITEIDDYAFYGCSNLTEITILSRLTSIGEHAFVNCYKLTSITLPDTVTSLGEYAFRNCKGLTYIVFPVKLKTVGVSVFSNCSSYVVYYGGTQDQWSAITNRPTSNCQVVYYKASEPATDKYLYWHYVDDVPTLWAEPAIYSIEGGALSLTGYGKTQLSGSVIVPAEIDGVAITSIAKDGFNGSHITSITFSEGLRSIGAFAFANCNALTTINLPTTINGIGDHAFYYCSSLTEIIIPNGVTNISSGMFSYCDNLADITLSNNLKNIASYAFYDCKKLVNVVLPTGFQTIGNMAFSGCSSLASINLPVSVTEIGESAFEDCKSLTNIIIPEGITNINRSAFSGCGGLESISLPSTITSIGAYAFRGCLHLSNIYLLNNTSLHFGDCAFAYAYGVRDIYAANFTIAQMVAKLERTELPYAIIHCSDGNTTFGVNCEYVLNDGTKQYEAKSSGKAWSSKVVSINFPSYGYTIVGMSAMGNCINVTSIVLPQAVTKIYNDAFYNCRSLTTIKLGANVSNIENNAFYGCDGLRTVIIDSQYIANALITKTSQQYLVNAATTIYIKDGLTTSSSTYLTGSFHSVSSDIAGYIKYVKN